MNKEEACRLGIEAVSALADSDERIDQPEPEPEQEHEPTLAAPLRRLHDLQLPDKLLRRVIAAVLEHAVTADIRPPADNDTEPDGDANDEDERVTRLLWAACSVVRAVKRAPLGEPLRALLQAHHPHRRLPGLLAHAIRQVRYYTDHLGILIHFKPTVASNFVDMFVLLRKYIEELYKNFLKI